MNKNIHMDFSLHDMSRKSSIEQSTNVTLKIFIVMKCTLLLVCGFLFQVQANVFSQEISLKVKNESIETVLKEIRKQSGYSFFLNADLLKKANYVSVDIQKKSVKDALNEVFEDQPLGYLLDGRNIIIQKRNSTHENLALRQNDQETTITGKVVNDSSSIAIIGATIKSLPSGKTALTDTKGNFRLVITSGDNRISFSYLGMQTIVKELGEKRVFDIRLKSNQVHVEDVVVTGLFKKSKESFTGASRSFSGEELKAVAPTSVIEAISMLTPGVVTMEQKAFGSDPNRLPDILIRGVTSFANTDQSVNQPLIVRDGTIVTLQDLYDMDINEIESITILKDASAAALYGARAANGVIVIERKRIAEGKLRLAYNFIGSVQNPDFADYQLLNPVQKLEYERLAGLYTSTDNAVKYQLDSLYNVRFKDIRTGVFTDWMKQPSRIGSTQDHSLRLNGGSYGTRYELNGRFAQVRGVMKGDARDRYGLGFMLEHYAPKGFSFTNRTNFIRVQSKASPYGAFSNYINMNPYDRIYDQYGEYNKILSWDQPNPLYEASLGSYDRSSNQTISNDFDARWNINNNFRVTTHWNLSLINSSNDIYRSPLSGDFRNVLNLSEKGLMTESNTKNLTYSGNIVVSYNKQFSGESLLSANAGGTINKMDSRNTQFGGIGFYSDRLSFMNFAVGYPINGKPGGAQDINADVSSFLNLNYSLKNKYYVDGVYQISGSSKFGANNRYGQFWSGGLGWNLHNEPIFKSDIVNLLKIRSSVGYTGKVSFASYQALTTYQYREALLYYNGIGAVPMTIGNPDLRWERTMNYNIGTDISLLDRRVNLTADFYIRRTKDLLIDKAVAPSTGVSTGKDNLGEMENKGIEIHADAFPIRNSLWSWQVGTNLSHNRNKILKISNALERQNQQNNNAQTIAPLPQFQEGESTTALKVVRSGGIDPATGQEIFIKRNGDRTFVYDPVDKVVVGDQMPVLSGNVFSTLRYKRLSLVAYFGFTTGGYIYNTTRATKVEGANPMFNADERVFADRWKQPGDIALYKDIADRSTPRHTTRFVEKENTLVLNRLNIAYDFAPSFAKKIGASKCSFGISMNDLFRASTVRMERGTTYLYSRGMDFNLNILF